VWTLDDGGDANNTTSVTQTLAIDSNPLYVASAHVSSGLTIANGLTLIVLSGGTAEVTAVSSGGSEIVSGLESGGAIFSGGVQTLAAGGGAGGRGASGGGPRGRLG